MKRRIIKVLLLAVTVGLIFAAVPFAQDAALPSGEKVLKMYIDATGGEDAYESIKNSIMIGTYSMPKMGLKANIKMYVESPNKMYSMIESDSLGKMETGSDGNTVWENSAMTGPNIKKGSERESALLDASLDKFSNWKDYYSSIKCTGIENVEGKPCYILKMTTKEGMEITSYVDKSSGLIVKTSATMESPMGKIATESFLSDYRDVGGVKMPFNTTTKVMGQEISIVFSTIKINTKMPAGIFDLPAEVKALLAK